jgi:hypothetical protein
MNSRSAEASGAKAEGGRPLEQLLHALNQPLTGLQCALEVALAAERPVEHYVGVLREGLKLTERMYVLVGALREVAEIADSPQSLAGEIEQEQEAEAEQKESEERKGIELAGLLAEIVEDLRPVAEAKRVRIRTHWALPARLGVTWKGKKSCLTGLLFRTLESTLGLAEGGSEMEIATRIHSAGGGVAVHVHWLGRRAWEEAAGGEYSRPELGLLVARAGLEKGGVRWERSRQEGLDRLKLRLEVQA